jgi:hypothetical protein
MASTVYDPIMNALLSYLQTYTNFGTVGASFLTMKRGIIMWEQLAQKMDSSPILRQPALFLYDGIGFGGGVTKYDERGRSRPVVRIIDRTIVIYAQVQAPGNAPGGQLGGKGIPANGGGAIFHPLIEAVETAIARPDNNLQGTLTLGGLVSHCWLEGDGHILSPDIDDNGQGMATLPVRIMVP